LVNMGVYGRKQSTRTQRSFWKSDSKWRYPSRKGHMCSTFVQMNKGAHKWFESNLTNCCRFYQIS
jgi:hypothetical protein